MFLLGKSVRNFPNVQFLVNVKSQLSAFIQAQNFDAWPTDNLDCTICQLANLQLTTFRLATCSSPAHSLLLTQ